MEALREAERLASVLEKLGDEKGQALAWGLVGNLRSALERHGSAEQSFAKACEHARRAKNQFLESRMMCYMLAAKALGPTPVPDALTYGRSLLERADAMPRVGLYARTWVASLLAVEGQFADARSLFAEASTMAERLGHSWVLAWQPAHEADAELLAGDPVAAEEKLRCAIHLAGSLGDAYRSELLAALADALYRQDRLGEAAQVLAQAPQISVLSSPAERVPWLSIAARIRARRGDDDAEAERLAREAVRAIGETDNLHEHGNTLLDLTEVLMLAGRHADAIPAVEQAIELYERKGATFSAERARALLAELTAIGVSSAHVA